MTILTLAHDPAGLKAEARQQGSGVKDIERRHLDIPNLPKVSKSSVSSASSTGSTVSVEGMIRDLTREFLLKAQLEGIGQKQQKAGSHLKSHFLSRRSLLLRVDEI